MNFTGLGASQMLTLFGALGGAMVLLYILKLRRRRVEVPFSPLWARVVQEKQSTSLFKKLKRLLSLLVQLALLALIVFALGSPELSGDVSGCNYEKAPPPPERHTLIMLDASASMSAIELGQTRVERARQEALRIVERLGDNPNHRAMVVQVDGKVRPLSLWTSDREALKGAIDAYAPDGALDTPTDVEQALDFVKPTIRGRDNAETVFVTDRAFTTVQKETAEKLNLKVVPVGDGGANVGLQAFNVRPYLDDSLTYAIFYGIRNDTDRDLKATLLLYANEDGHSVDDFVERGSLVGSYALTLPAGKVLEDVVDNVAFNGSRLMAKIEIDQAEPVRDLLPRDDVAFAVVPERRKLKVQLVTEGNLFLHASLFVRENVEFEVVEPGAYQGPEGYDVTVVDSANVDMSRPGAYFVINPQEGNGEFAIEGELEEPSVQRVNKKHPIARNLKFVDFNVSSMPAIDLVKGDHVAAYAQKRKPMLFTRVDVEGRRMFAVLAFDIRKSLLPLNYAFPLLVVNTLNWFYQEDDALLKPNRAGTDLSVAFPREGTDVKVAGPPTPAPVHARKVGDRVHFETDRIGIYELDTEEAGSEAPPLAVAVNLMSESESRVAPQGEYAAWQAPPKWEKKEHFWLDHLWRLLLVAALGLLAIEWLTYHRRLTV